MYYRSIFNDYIIKEHDDVLLLCKLADYEPTLAEPTYISNCDKLPSSSKIKDLPNIALQDIIIRDFITKTKTSPIEVFPPEIKWTVNNCGDEQPYSATCIEEYYYLDDDRKNYYRNDDRENCTEKNKLHDPFIFLADYKISSLKPGDIFEQSTSHILYQIPYQIRSYKAYYSYACCDGTVCDSLTPCNIHGQDKSNCNDDEESRIIIPIIKISSQSTPNPGNSKPQNSEPTPPPTNPSAQAPAQPTAIPTSSSSDESSMLYNTNGSWKIQLHGNIPTSEGEKIALLLNQWNDAMNQHNADAVAKTHTNNARIRGKFYTIEAYRDKEAKAFKKHPDFAQSPVSDVYAAPLQNKKGYYLIFDLMFSQGGKDTRTEIMLVVLHDGVNYKIDYESDISTDRNLIEKMGIDTIPSSKACTQLAEQILMESPQFRYEYYIPDELLSLVCENNECSIGMGSHGIIVENYEFDYKSMQFTIQNFNDNSEYTYTIHPKYTSQIRQLCP